VNVPIQQAKQKRGVNGSAGKNNKGTGRDTQNQSLMTGQQGDRLYDNASNPVRGVNKTKRGKSGGGLKTKHATAKLLVCKKPK